MLLVRKVALKEWLEEIAINGKMSGLQGDELKKNSY
jgi:hypothetical protein